MHSFKDTRRNVRSTRIQRSCRRDSEQKESRTPAAAAVDAHCTASVAAGRTVVEACQAEACLAAACLAAACQAAACPAGARPAGASLSVALPFAGASAGADAASVAEAAGASAGHRRGSAATMTTPTASYLPK